MKRHIVTLNSIRYNALSIHQEVYLAIRLLWCDHFVFFARALDIFTDYVHLKSAVLTIFDVCD